MYASTGSSEVGVIQDEVWSDSPDILRHWRNAITIVFRWYRWKSCLPYIKPHYYQHRDDHFMPETFTSVEPEFYFFRPSIVKFHLVVFPEQLWARLLLVDSINFGTGFSFLTEGCHTKLISQHMTQENGVMKLAVTRHLTVWQVLNWVLPTVVRFGDLSPENTQWLCNRVTSIYTWTCACLRISTRLCKYDCINNTCMITTVCASE